MFNFFFHVNLFIVNTEYLYIFLILSKHHSETIDCSAKIYIFN